MHHEAPAVGPGPVEVGVGPALPEDLLEAPALVQAVRGVDRVTCLVPQDPLALASVPALDLEHLPALEEHQARVRQVEGDGDPGHAVGREPLGGEPDVRRNRSPRAANSWYRRCTRPSITVPSIFRSRSLKPRRSSSSSSDNSTHDGSRPPAPPSVPGFRARSHRRAASYRGRTTARPRRRAPGGLEDASGRTRDRVPGRGNQLSRFLAVPSGATEPRPAVLVFPTWKGLEDFAKGEARQLAERYVACGVDMYGEGAIAASDGEAGAWMGALLDDRARLRNRARTACEAVQARAEVDADRVAAIGFCFGGLCALDLARSGADVRGVASFHGFFRTPDPSLARSVRGRVLAFHGSEDPLVPWSDVESLRAEMTAARVDWELVVFGGAAHGFMNPAARAPERGVAYHADAARRARARLAAFLVDVLRP